MKQQTTIALRPEKYTNASLCVTQLSIIQIEFLLLLLVIIHSFLKIREENERKERR